MSANWEPINYTNVAGLLYINWGDAGIGNCGILGDRYSSWYIYISSPLGDICNAENWMVY